MQLAATSDQVWIYIFRRDLRLDDNLNLAAAMSSGRVIPIFILSLDQIDPSQNTYFSSNCVQFMVESLVDLDKQIKVFSQNQASLAIMAGSNESAIRYLKSTYPFITGVATSIDVTPYARTRNAEIAKLCTALGLDFTQGWDQYLLPIDTIYNKSGAYYRAFKYFDEQVEERAFAEKRRPVPLTTNNFLSIQFDPNYLNNDKLNILYTANPQLAVHGGRSLALQQLGKIKNFANYISTREQPIIPSTMMSAYLKFGCVSEREFYWTIIDTLGRGALSRELVFRDFAANLMYHLPPYDTVGGGNMKHRKITWETDLAHWTAWSTGCTGFPFIDAGIRQLLATGYMHNKARMPVANFLALIYRINWRWGEQFFAQHLVDYDVAANNMNWQDVVGLGYTNPKGRGGVQFYVPANQLRDHDGTCAYVKTWITELSTVPVPDILSWESSYSKYNVGYPGPTVNYKEEQAKTISWKESWGIY